MCTQADVRAVRSHLVVVNWSPPGSELSRSGCSIAEAARWLTPTLREIPEHVSRKHASFFDIHTLLELHHQPRLEVNVRLHPPRACVAPRPHGPGSPATRLPRTVETPRGAGRPRPPPTEYDGTKLYEFHSPLHSHNHDHGTDMHLPRYSRRLHRHHHVQESVDMKSDGPAAAVALGEPPAAHDDKPAKLQRTLEVNGTA